MHEKILILDFGSQYTQLIARRIRELNVYCEIKPYHADFQIDDSLKAIILSGSPFSVNDKNAPSVTNFEKLLQRPLLGVCYGAQLLAKHFGGKVERSKKREYGKATLNKIKTTNTLFNNIKKQSQVWMSHGDTIIELPDCFQSIASTESIQVAAFTAKKSKFNHPVYGFQFHPEVTHSDEGLQLIKNFIVDIAGCRQNWTPKAFVAEQVEQIKKQVGEDKVLLGLSGGVDSSVAALLLHRAIGKQLVCFFIDNGLLRKNEFKEVLASYKHMGLSIKGIDAKEQFYYALKDITNPEHKRKAIGKTFIDVFEAEAKKMKDVKWLAQGTIYPDVIESVSVHGPSVTIKSHHNVGGLPDKLHLKIIEPLRMLFKDEVRRVGKALKLDSDILSRHPFPGPGLGIRILGAITPEKVAILQAADAVYIDILKKKNLYTKIWQAGAILLPVYSVGVMGDERTYEQTIALRAVVSVDGMTAEWFPFPHDVLAEISTSIINQVKGINRVVYDISTKPPATIEWE